MKKLFQLLFMIALTGIAGCASVQEINPTEQIELKGTNKALLRGDSEHNHTILRGIDQQVLITKLDGERLFRLGWGSDYPTAILVTPGRHRITVKYIHFGRFSDFDLWLDAVVEKRYIVRHLVKGDKISMWIENEETGERVGGLAGGEPSVDGEKEAKP